MDPGSSSRRRLTAAVIGCLALGAEVGACGGSTENPGEPGSVETAASTEDVEAMCQASCEHNRRCQAATNERCVFDCVTRAGPPASLSQQAISIYADCARDPACIDDDTCESRMSERDPAIEPEVRACSAFQVSCPSRTDGSTCLRIRALLPDVRARSGPCYTGVCTNTARFVDCLQAAWGG